MYFIDCFHFFLLKTQFCVSKVETKGEETEDPFLSTRSPDVLSAVDAVSQISPTISASRGQVESTASPQPAKIPPPSERRETSQHPQIPVVSLSGLLTLFTVC